MQLRRLRHPEDPTAHGRRHLATLVACLAVVLAVALGVGGWLHWKDPEPARAGDGLRHTVEKAPTATPEKAPAKIEAKTVLRVDAPELRVGFHAGTPGSWATEQSYVLTEDAAISAYSFRTGGKRLWTIPLSGEVCVASPHVTTDGLTAVVFKKSRPKRPGSRIACNQLAVFDIDSGKKLWQVTLPAVSRFDGQPSMAISDGVVAASWTRWNSRWESRTVAYPLTGGKALWSEKRNSGKSSQDIDVNGGAGLITGVRMHSTRTDHIAREVRKLDPRTGRPEWTYRIPKGYDSFQIASTEPVVLAVSENDYDQESEATHLLSLDDQGRLRATISLDDGRYDPGCASYLPRTCRTLTVSGDTLYMPTGRHHKESKRANSIFEFDLKTGKNKGRLAVAEAAQQIVPLRMSGDRVLALQVGYESKAAAKVYSIDPATRRKYPLLTTVVSNPDITSLMDLTNLRSKPLFQHGRLLFSRTECEGPARSTDRKSDIQPGDQFLGVAFGAA